MLFSFSFWTGCIAQGYVQVVPNKHTQPLIENLITQLGYQKKSEERAPGTSYIYHKGAYLVCSSALSRTFALLGLPYREGNKSTAVDFNLPWYVRFMNEEFCREKQTLNPQQKVDQFRRMFCYVLLSERTHTIAPNRKDGVTIELMTTYSKEVGQAFTRQILTMFRTAFGIEISEEEIFQRQRNTEQTKSHANNRIYLRGEHVNTLLNQMEIYIKSEHVVPYHIQVRQAAAMQLEQVLNTYSKR